MNIIEPTRTLKWSRHTPAMSNFIPTFFIGHGNPMNAVTSNGYTEAWRRIGQETSIHNNNKELPWIDGSGGFKHNRSTSNDVTFADIDLGAIRIKKNVRALGLGFLTTFNNVGNLGANSAAATTPGSVTKKIEVFDGLGNSLGFIPVYGRIT